MTSEEIAIYFKELLVAFGPAAFYIFTGLFIFSLNGDSVATQRNQDTQKEEANEVSKSVQQSAQAAAPSPAPNNGDGKKHGNDEHNDKIDQKVEELKKDGTNRDIRKNQQQVDANGNKVGNNRPDVQWTDKDGVRHYQEYDHNPASSLKHAEEIMKNDPSGIVHLENLD
jgi:hypothetical protein